jgi:hypothetical protein
MKKFLISLAMVISFGMASTAKAGVYFYSNCSPIPGVRLVIQTPPTATFVVVPPHRHWAAIPTPPYHPVVIVRTYPHRHLIWRNDGWF